MELLKENREILNQKYKKCLKKIERMEMSECIRVHNTKDGDRVIGIEQEDRIWFLNSKLQPEYAAQVYADRYEIREFGVYFIFGLSDGKHVRKLLEKCDKTNQIIVFEPDANIFYTACIFFALKDLLEDDRVIICVPDVIGRIESAISSMVSFQKMNVIEMCILPGYDILYRKAYLDFEDKVIAVMRENVITRNTKFNIGRKNPQHTLYHIKNMISHNNGEQLKQELAKYDLSKIPAIIVSAGPSLDKNVHELKKAQGKAFIVVVDAAIKTVIQAGVRPDMICTIDFQAPDYFFEGIDQKGLVWTFGSLSKPLSMEQADDKIFYHGYYCRYWSKLLLETVGYAMPGLASGGSVSTEAFTFVYYLGFKKIVLVGQDLAFTNGVSHTRGALGAFGNNADYIKSRNIVQVEGINGELLNTDFQMWEYKRWFERMIQINMDKFDLIDATEGGAKIEGTEILKLEDVIERECKTQLDIYDILQNMPQAFTKDQQEKLLNGLKHMRDLLQDLREKVDNAIVRQENILEALKTGDSIAIKENLSEMVKDNNEIGKHWLFDLMTMYAFKEEYDLGADIYTKKDMKIEELVERSLNLYKGYQKAIDMFEEDIEECIIKD